MKAKRGIQIGIIGIVLFVGVFIFGSQTGLLSVTPVYSVSVENGTKHVREARDMSLLDSMRRSLNKYSFTTIDGYLCSTYPDQTGDGETITCSAPYCAVDVFDEDYNYKMSFEMEDGETTTIVSPDLYELYECDEKADCSDWEAQGCGAGPCPEDDMYKTRDCDDPDKEEELCLDWTDCEEQSQEVTGEVVVSG